LDLIYILYSKKYYSQPALLFIDDINDINKEDEEDEKVEKNE